MTAAETMYGRRGGGWAPKPTATKAQAPDEKKDPTCRVCGRLYSGHTGRLCPACLLPIEHHTPSPQDIEDGRPVTSADDCWASRARMVHAKRQAGGVLNDVELTAVRRFPVPVTLTVDGYTAVPMNGAA